MRLRPCRVRSCSAAGTHSQRGTRTAASGSKTEVYGSGPPCVGRPAGRVCEWAGARPQYGLLGGLGRTRVSLGVKSTKSHTPLKISTPEIRKETPSPSMALQGPFNSVPLLTKPNIKPAGKGEMLTESRSHVTKQGKEGIWRGKAINRDLAQRGAGRAD